MPFEHEGNAGSIPYYDHLMQGEREEVTECIRQLLRQTFILERKYEKRTARFQYNRDFRVCTKHLEFIRRYFSISGITVRENSQMGLIYIQGETLVGDKLPKLATLYLLVLKLIYDEQMESVSTSVHVHTSLKELHEKLGNYRLFKRQPSLTDIRRTIALLKKHQVVESLDRMEEINGDSRLIIYPCINVVLMGDDVRRLLASFEEEQSEDGGNPDSQETEEPAEDEEEDGGPEPEAIIQNKIPEASEVMTTWENKWEEGQYNGTDKNQG